MWIQVTDFIPNTLKSDWEEVPCSNILCIEICNNKHGLVIGRNPMEKNFRCPNLVSVYQRYICNSTQGAIIAKDWYCDYQVSPTSSIWFRMGVSRPHWLGSYQVWHFCTISRSFLYTKHWNRSAGTGSGENFQGRSDWACRSVPIELWPMGFAQDWLVCLRPGKYPSNTNKHFEGKPLHI